MAAWSRTCCGVENSRDDAVVISTGPANVIHTEGDHKYDGRVIIDTAVEYKKARYRGVVAGLLCFNIAADQSSCGGFAAAATTIFVT